jgi:hypothetical protein
MSYGKLVEGTQRRNPANEDGEANMTIGDYSVSGKPYWLTMTGVAALGLVGVALMLSVM